jgi:hypothetical protein
MTTTFSLQRAAESANASFLAYGPVTVESDLAHVLIVEHEDYRLAHFRGTKNPLDWFTDAKVRFVEYPKGSGLYVHSGFNESMLSVRGKLMDKLASLPPKPTSIGGHSKGAGESRQFISGLTDDEKSAIGFCDSYTFGEPRSLGRRAAIAYDQKYRDVTFRMVHLEDFVAHIPWLLGRYRHAGQTILLSSFGAMLTNPPVWLRLASDGYGLFKSWQTKRAIGLLAEPLQDHFIVNYCDAIQKLTPPFQPAILT